MSAWSVVGIRRVTFLLLAAAPLIIAAALGRASSVLAEPPPRSVAPDAGVASPEAPPPCVVTLTAPAVLPVNGSIDVVARASIPGGTFLFVATQSGTGRVSLSPSMDHVLVTGTAASSTLNDVVITVTYTQPQGGTCTASCRLTVVEIQVTNIIFDHRGPETFPGDGLNIRAGFESDLRHLGSGKGTEGEWIRHGAGRSPRNEPVLYLARQAVTCKARFTVQPAAVRRITLSAESGVEGFPGIMEKVVNFAGGVSTPEFVTMNFSGNTPAVVFAEDVSLRWWVSRIDGGPARFQFDASGPHRIYVALAVPTGPWLQEQKPVGEAPPVGKQYREKTHPWADALEFATRTAGAKGAATPAEVATRITRFVFDGFGLQYQIATGRPAYVDPRGGNDGRFGFGDVAFRCTEFMARSRGRLVNCGDCSAAVVTLCDLLGAPATYTTQAPWGYILQTSLIGRGNTNSPIGAARQLCILPPRAGPPPIACPQDVAQRGPCVSDCTNPDRSRFVIHAYVLVGGRVFDACAGPELGTRAEAAFLNAGIDRTTPAEAVAAGVRAVGGAPPAGVAGSVEEIR